MKIRQRPVGFKVRTSLGIYLFGSATAVLLLSTLSTPAASRLGSRRSRSTAAPCSGLEDAHQREVLPLFRRGGAAESFEGFDAQLDRLEAEPGVRQQL